MVKLNSVSPEISKHFLGNSLNQSMYKLERIFPKQSKDYTYSHKTVPNATFWHRITKLAFLASVCVSLRTKN